MVTASTPPIWPSSQTAPLVTQLLIAAEHAVDAEAGCRPADAGRIRHAPRRPSRSVRDPHRRGAPADRAGRPRAGTAGRATEGGHGQCTPCPALKKKLTMAGPAPISRAASPETSTARRPT